MSNLLLKVTRFVIGTVLIVGSLLTQHVLRAEQAGKVTVTNSHRQQISAPGYTSEQNAAHVRSCLIKPRAMRMSAI
jgi:hypothetical protein